MSTFVLVHGSWHGGWCWEKVVPILEQKGHKAVAPDLPGHGSDHTPAEQVTLERYAESVVEVLDGLSGPVVLVGHSSGGEVASEVAERRPEQVKLLVYLAAYLLPNGKSALDIWQPDGETIGDSSTDVDESRGVITVRADRAKEFLYGDCSEEDARWATERLVSESLKPFATPVSVSEENFGRVRRTYIETLRDKTIGPSTQKRMYTEVPCEKVVSMETSHSPFLSRPQELVGHLDSLTRPS